MNFKSFLLAIQFLTILPVTVRSPITPQMVGRSVGLFPLTGALLGVLLAFATAALSQQLPSFLAAPVALAWITALSGGFHLDALANTFNALTLPSRGDPARDREKRLQVMKEGTTGAVGLVALVLVLLIKYGAFLSILGQTAGDVRQQMFVFFLLPVFGRWAMVPGIVRGRPARPEGFGKKLMDPAGKRDFFIGLFFVCMSGLAAFFLWHPVSPDRGIAYFVAGVAMLGYLIAECVHRIGDRLFGGLTGDLLGSISELAEIGYLLVVSAWLQYSI